jgi:hypothetical protein
MPMLYMCVKPEVDCELLKYEEYIILYDIKNIAVINNISLKNTSTEDLKELYLIIPFPIEAILSCNSNARTCTKNRYYEKFSTIRCDFDLVNFIKPGEVRELVITYDVEDIKLKKTSKGFQFQFLLYNLVPFKGNNGNNIRIPDKGIPKIQKNGLVISFILPCGFFNFNNNFKAYAFDENTETETDTGILSEPGKFCECFDSLDTKNECKIKLECLALPYRKKWQIASMTAPKFGGLEEAFLPACEARAWNFGFIQKDYVVIGAYNIRFLDIITLVVGLVALLIALR